MVTKRRRAESDVTRTGPTAKGSRMSSPHALTAQSALWALSMGDSVAHWAPGNVQGRPTTERGTISGPAPSPIRTMYDGRARPHHRCGEVAACICWRAPLRQDVSLEAKIHGFAHSLSRHRRAAAFAQPDAINQRLLSQASRSFTKPILKGRNDTNQLGFDSWTEKQRTRRPGSAPARRVLWYLNRRLGQRRLQRASGRSGWPQSQAPRSREASSPRSRVRALQGG